MIEETDQLSQEESLKMASDIVSAYVSFNQLPANQIGEMIRDIHGTLMTLTRQAELEAEKQKPAVPVKKSITPDYLICLEDGKKLKMLKRYLRSRYDLSPDEYRAKWGLSSDYPMVAPNYAEKRSEFAKKIGLGKTATPKRRGRRKAA